MPRTEEQNLDSEFSFYVNKRKYIRIESTRLHNSISTDIDSFDRNHSLSLISKLKDLLINIVEMDDQISKLMWSLKKTDSEMETEYATCDGYKEKLNYSLILLEERVKVGRGTQEVRSIDLNGKPHLRGLTVPLPVFKGEEDEEFDRFIKNFEAAVERFSYSSYEKFLLLKEQVKGKPSTLLDSLEIGNQTYDHAKNLLTLALASPITQKFNTIKKLSNLKLTYESEPFQFISQFKNINESLVNLKIDINDIKQYFVWLGLNDTFRTQLMLITGQTKPTLSDIEKHFFEAAERYADIVKKYKKTRLKPKGEDVRSGKYVEKINEVNNLAINIKPKDSPTNNSNSASAKNLNSTNSLCKLCKDTKFDAKHMLYKCKNFPNPEMKVEKLAHLGACVNCANFGHASKDCMFRFKNACYICQGAHFGFLCTNGTNKSQGTAGISNNTTKIQNSVNPAKSGASKREIGTVCFEVKILTTSANGDALLPTLTCKAKNSVVRILVDSGSQGSFITENKVIENDFKVHEERVKITLRGMNSERGYLTSYVDVPLMIGEVEYIVKALCIPTIDFDLNLSELGKIYDQISQLGYTFADKKIDANSYCINDLDFILGADAMHILNKSIVHFGKDPKSLYYKTNLGIILVGKTSDILRNIPFLPAQHLREKVLAAVGVKSRTAPSETEDDCEIIGEVNKKTEFNPYDAAGKLVISEIERATTDMLNNSYQKYIDYDKFRDTEGTSDIDNAQLDFVIDNAVVREQDGRIEMPLIWNTRVAHLLGNNQNLASQILHSNLKKYYKKEGYLKMIDDSFKEQEKAGIIERILDINKFIEENPSHSFLAHMPVFRLSRETTKCRVVFLSNLCERDPYRPKTISHNQAMLSGPCLNQKLTTALLTLRFDMYIFTFDIKKAFSQIALNVFDQNKLLFFWHNNVSKDDYTVVAFKNKRLPFGLRCSPTILMTALYKILIMDTASDSKRLVDLKKSLYATFYVDNGAYTSNSLSDLSWASSKVVEIFGAYNLELQQFHSNRASIFGPHDDEDCTTKLFGLDWNKETDCLSPRPLKLASQANTKRQILQSLASNFDPFNFAGPLLNRARIFMHQLQCQKGLTWDAEIEAEQQKEWNLISNQVNGAPALKIDRFVGERNGRYRFVAFTDASKHLVGVVIYIQDLDSGRVSFITAKNRMVTRSLETKSIPSLELHAIHLGVESLIDLYKDMTSSDNVIPVNITELELYTDSLVSLNWINSYCSKLDKMNKKSAFVINRLDKIRDLCDYCPVTFRHITGHENPADYITRAVSFKSLTKSNYYSGPFFLTKRNECSVDSLMEIIVPEPLIQTKSDRKGVTQCWSTIMKEIDSSGLYIYNYCMTQFSSIDRMIAVIGRVRSFINKLKTKLLMKDPTKYQHFKLDGLDCHSDSILSLVKWDQEKHFSEIVDSLLGNNESKKDTPPLVWKWNLFLDRNNMIRVKSKFGRNPNVQYPLLLAKDSQVTLLLIRDMHAKMSHAGCYTVISEMRKSFWISQCFSVVKKVVRSCIHCRRFSNQTVKLNQAPYREFRTDPPSVPFRSIFVDYCGPFKIKNKGENCQVWILVLTCLWSRAINLKICTDMSLASFCRAFQLHCFEYGLPQNCRSDLGSQIVAGGNVIQDFLRDPETLKYLGEHGMQSIKFEQFDKGHSELGSLVESCVKLTKRLLWGSVKNVVLEYFDFEFFVQKTIHLVNRRPIAFKEALRDDDFSAPDPITPENLIKGYDLVSVNVIPGLQSIPLQDLDWSKESEGSIEDKFSRLRKVRDKLREIYHKEFLGYLTLQATNREGRYKPMSHEKLEPGDIILLQDPFMKPTNYPMAIVTEVTVNVLGEVVGIVARKGKTKESVKRHVSSVIPLMKAVEYLDGNISVEADLDKEGSVLDSADEDQNPLGELLIRPSRRAAKRARLRNKNLSDQDLV